MRSRTKRVVKDSSAFLFFSSLMSFLEIVEEVVGDSTFLTWAKELIQKYAPSSYFYRILLQSAAKTDIRELSNWNWRISDEGQWVRHTVESCYLKTRNGFERSFFHMFFWISFFVLPFAFFRFACLVFGIVFELNANLRTPRHLYFNFNFIHFLG